jgi:ABC-type multidrug transport system ATPase subunit
MRDDPLARATGSAGHDSSDVAQSREVETLCARVAIISRGSIRAIDTPRNLRDLTSGSETVHITFAAAKRSRYTTHRRRSLDEKIRELQTRGKRIIDIETERATLLDVLKGMRPDERG